MIENNDKGVNKSVINWYPGHMAKTKRLIKENLNLIDIVYEIIDSRIPISSRVIDLDETIKNKPRILIFTKYDLCDKEETDKIIKYYESLGNYVLKYDLSKSNNFDELFNLTKQILQNKQNKLKERGLENNTIRALVVGIPNVGKSTLINQISKRKVAKVGNMPGITKNLNWIKVNKDILLLDTPGILWPKLSQETVAYNLASTTAIKEEILPKENVAIYILQFLNTYYPNILKDYYKIESIQDIESALLKIGKNKGYLTKGGEVDLDKLVDSILNDIKKGNIKSITFDRSPKDDQK